MERHFAQESENKTYVAHKSEDKMRQTNKQTLQMNEQESEDKR